jgi:C-terminal processing protease CtpA/Prc
MKTKLILIMAFMVTSAALAVSIVGVGLVLSRPNEVGPVKVTHVIPDSPAWNAGIKPGFWIVSIDGTNTADITTLSNCVRLIRGVPNTQVTLGVVDPIHHQTNTVVLERVPISQKQIEK